MFWRFRRPSRSEPGRAGAATAAITAVAIAFGSVDAAAAEERYAVVVSDDVPLTNVTSAELRRIMRFERRFWRAGLPITLVFSEGSLQDDSYLLASIYRLSYRELRALILAKLYQGQIDLAPTVLASDEAVVAAVAAGSGLLGFVRVEAVAGTGVRVLAIDSRAPDDPGYPLRR